MTTITTKTTPRGFTPWSHTGDTCTRHFPFSEQDPNDHHPVAWEERQPLHPTRRWRCIQLDGASSLTQVLLSPSRGEVPWLAGLPADQLDRKPWLEGTTPPTGPCRERCLDPELCPLWDECAP